MLSIHDANDLEIIQNIKNLKIDETFDEKSKKSDVIKVSCCTTKTWEFLNFIQNTQL